MSDKPKSLIINSPYKKPYQHWADRKADGSLKLVPERRSAGYEIIDTRHNTRRVEPLKLVNDIRRRVDDWRAAGYPGITSVTRKLLEHWHDPEADRQYKFYFCQLEAVETLMWWVEAQPEFKQGVAIPGDGGAWERLCNKMATGTGKTTVMAMVIAWQVLNAVTYEKERRFSRFVFVVAPGITVKERLQVLQPSHENNYYDQFDICPSDAMRQKLNRVELVIENWHQLMPLKALNRSVVKKGPESDEAYTRRVLGKLAGCKDIVVINDEAHHAYRIPAEIKVKKTDDFNPEEATRWIEGLDRIHKTRRILRCFDLSATPFAPTGKRSTEAGLFEWIVSDFGLNDAIEAGLVKTPRVVIRDDALPDAKSYRSKLYHIYNDQEVKETFNRKADPTEPLPDLVQKAYTLLGADWLAAKRRWEQEGHTIRPVMLTVCNRTETAARVEHYFNKGDAHFEELHVPERTLRVDSKVLEKAEVGETATKDAAYEARLGEIIEHLDIPEMRKADLLAMRKEEQLRAIVDNVGKPGTAGQGLQNVISVAMLSEGWNAKNVTHIMGLRAFTSQLLCEQVIGRGLRRVGYETDENGLFLPEYVNIFGVPLSIFQDVGEGGEAPPPPKPSTQIEVIRERNQLEISWPNVLRVDTVMRQQLEVDWDRVETLEIASETTPISAELAPMLAGETDLSKVSLIDLTKIDERFRLQRMIFQAARKVFEQTYSRHWKGNKEYLVFQIIRIVEAFIASDKLFIPSLFYQDEVRRRVLLTMNIDRIVEHVCRFIRAGNKERIEPVFDPEFPIRSTANMRQWYTTKPCHPTRRSQISHVVFDSTWEAAEAYTFEHNDMVSAYAKNDHLGFFISYIFNGVVRKYYPDYLVRLTNGKNLILEVKGQDSAQNKSKREALDTWVKAINEKGGFGQWCWGVAFRPADIYDILAEHVHVLDAWKPGNLDLAGSELLYELDTTFEGKITLTKLFEHAKGDETLFASYFSELQRLSADGYLIRVYTGPDFEDRFGVPINFDEIADAYKQFKVVEDYDGWNRFAEQIKVAWKLKN